MVDAPLQRLMDNILRPVRFRKALKAAQAAKKKGRFAEAADYYRAALSQTPSHLGVKVQLANMLKDSRSFSEAEAIYRSALSDDPLNADTHLQLGHLLKLTGRRSLAMAAYRRSRELDPLSAHAQHELAAAGEASAQLTAFEVQMRHGATEAVLAISTRLAELSRQIEDIRGALPDALAATAFPVETYAELRRTYDVAPPEQRAIDISFAIVVLADREDLERLHLQISAIRDQTHRYWRLQVIGAAPDRREIVERARASDARINWIETAQGESPPHAELHAAALAGCDWTVLTGETGLLHRHALAWLAAAADRTGCDAFVMDEEVGDFDGISGDLRPILRQVVDRDTLLDANVYGETLAVRTTALPTTLNTMTVSMAEARGALLLDILADHAVGHVPLPLVSSLRASDELAWPNPAEPRPSAETGIAVIIPTRDNVRDLAPFVDSLISMAAAPAALDILLLNNGTPLTDNPVLQMLAALPRVRVRDITEPFNWSRLNNVGASMSTAPYLVFANDDMLNLTQDWDDVVRTALERKDVGVVGARLLYPDNTLQHAGILFDWRGSVIHDGLYQPLGVDGPTRRWVSSRSVSAVTGAFLGTRRTDFEAMGGFDEVHLAVSYSDVDYCLKLRAHDLRILWTPRLTLRHFESKSRGLDHLDPAKAARNSAERRAIEHRWPNVFNHEPSLNPFWVQATLPHRLISYPSSARVWNHIHTSAATNPWRVPPPKSDLSSQAAAQDTFIRETRI